MEGHAMLHADYFANNNASVWAPALLRSRSWPAFHAWLPSFAPCFFSASKKEIPLYFFVLCNFLSCMRSSIERAHSKLSWRSYPRWLLSRVSVSPLSVCLDI
jgi:hypothetical protein